MAKLSISGRGMVAWPVSGNGGTVTVTNPSATVPIYVQTLTSAGVVFDVAKVLPGAQVTISFPAGGTCRAYAGQDITNVTVI
jgi:hypothetical protein